MAQTLTLPIQLRFGDMDAYGHVNNVIFLRYFENARVQLMFTPLSKLGVAESTDGETFNDLVGEDHFTLVGHQEIEYRQPLMYQVEPISIDIWVPRMGGSSYDFGYVISATDDDGAPVYALGTSTQVLVNRKTGRPERLTDRQREALAVFVGEPVPFRRNQQG